MRCVALRNVAPLIVEEVAQGGDGTTSVKGPVAVWQDEHEVTALTTHTAPLSKGRERVRQVLERVGGQHEVVRTVLQSVEMRGFAQVLGPEPTTDRCELPAVAEPVLPQSGPGEVHVIEACHLVVQRDQVPSSELPAGAADLQPSGAMSKPGSWRSDRRCPAQQPVADRLSDARQALQPHNFKGVRRLHRTAPASGPCMIIKVPDV